MAAASVILDIPSRMLRTPFTYDVPKSCADSVSVGCAVLVEFGSRPAVGWVVEYPLDTTLETLKPVKDVLSAPMFDEVAAALSFRIAEEYCAPPIDALRLWLPPGAAPRLVRHEGRGDGRATWALEAPSVAPVDERWVERVDSDVFEPAQNARVQRALLDAVSEGPVSTSELRASLGSIDAALRRLEELGAVRVFERRRYRSVSSSIRDAPRHEVLSQGQSDAIEVISAAGPGDVVLLDGITGSGKTEVYLRAIEDVLAQGLSAIVLVPEISLTPQTVGRFRHRFGESVAVLHSRLGIGERRDEWDRIADGTCSVVVGARSALFAPVRNLGLIVIDEEHSTSYKHGQAPRYDARRVAAWLAEARGCRVVMGSATPDMESVAAAEAGAVQSVRLPERVGGGSPPKITVIDMAEEFAAGHRSMFSRALISSLTETIAAKERTVLLLNRRGFASFLLCRECGHVPFCDACATSLTYHETGQGFLACHHCNARRAVPPVCPECGSPYLRLFGSGTQRVEHELRELFPETAVVRMDADTTKGKGGHERVLASFEATPGAVLLGTQMVSKGLDYPDVTLVGVLNADTTLRLPDFRSGERTYQLLAQVAGRAGRSERPGSVVIQTYWPSHPAIRAVAANDPDVFYTQERVDRKELGYPPYGRLANLIVTGVELDTVSKTAQMLAEAILSHVAEIDTTVLGPSPAPLARLKGRHRWHVLVRSTSQTLVPAIQAALDEVPPRAGVSVAVDIDPVDLL